MKLPFGASPELKRGDSSYHQSSKHGADRSRSSRHGPSVGGSHRGGSSHISRAWGDVSFEGRHNHEPRQFGFGSTTVSNKLPALHMGHAQPLSNHSATRAAEWTIDTKGKQRRTSVLTVANWDNGQVNAAKAALLLHKCDTSVDKDDQIASNNVKNFADPHLLPILLGDRHGHYSGDASRASQLPGTNSAPPTFNVNHGKAAGHSREVTEDSGSLLLRPSRVPNLTHQPTWRQVMRSKRFNPDDVIRKLP